MSLCHENLQRTSTVFENYFELKIESVGVGGGGGRGGKWEGGELPFK